MKVISNTLNCEIDRFDDPGGPGINGAGPAAPSYDYVAGVDGQIVIEVEAEDLAAGDYVDAIDWLADNSSEIDPELPHSTRVKRWTILKVVGLTLTLAVDTFEADAPNTDDPHDDYDPMEAMESSV